ncbi:NADH:flavin oxidoreductase/NADH oxidase [Ollibium composti]|uniref:NADH:flavin oxidoreductase/NADH oxidase n=1 Tax=Ollibium composti TaxID=2675109 RepID=A0ABY2Q2T1_9HYPH|nr:NADH:flavin oxidoreductase/NADH oxidase [Mesorhizobium composti]THF55296.1 NADH:flavin oxidoreductase/NADH oxidase [Mesorhizobium composti]
MTISSAPKLFQPLTLRSVTLKNRVVISPMCQHAARDGFAQPWHMVHYGKFALGGAGLVFTESTAVSSNARVGFADLGLWHDDHIAGLKAIVDFVHANGAMMGVQLAHPGRKAFSEPLWEGGRALTADTLDKSGIAWRRMGPSALAAGEQWSVPEEMTLADIATEIEAFAAATRRAATAGFDVVELHFGHGYLAASFLSPLANRRTDAYGGSRENRMRFVIEAAEAVRQAWPQDKPLFIRLSCLDGAEGSWGLGDTVVLASVLKQVGVDVIDCSSGGLTEETRSLTIPRGLGFQVPFAERVRREAGIPTQAVGLIVDPRQAEQILAEGKADLIAIGREALRNPYWANEAALALGHAEDHSTWSFRHAAWLAKREPIMRKIRDEGQLEQFKAAR